MFALCTAALIEYGFKAKQKLVRLWQLLILLTLSLVFLFVLAFAYKKDSTSGRLLIYKLSWRILQDSFPGGIGANRFESVYLNYQSEYFKAGAYTQKELLLADNTYTTFNDYLLFIIERGVIGLASGLLFLTSLACMIKKCFEKYEGRTPLLLKFSLLMLLVLLIAALFTHVFLHFHFFLCAFSSIAVLIFYTFFEGDKKVIAPYTTCYILFISIMVIGKFRYQILHSNSNKKWIEAQNLYFSGFVAEGISLMENIYSEMMKQENLNYLVYYSYALIKDSQFEKAIDITNHAIRKRPSNVLYENLGICHEALHQNPLAEKAFLEAVYMVPNRFGTRYRLFNFYLETKQYRKAENTGQQLLVLPIKIPSAQVNYIRESVHMKMHNLRYDQ